MTALAIITKPERASSGEQQQRKKKKKKKRNMAVRSVRTVASFIGDKIKRKQEGLQKRLCGVGPLGERAADYEKVTSI